MHPSKYILIMVPSSQEKNTSLLSSTSKTISLSNCSIKSKQNDQHDMILLSKLKMQKNKKFHVFEEESTKEEKPTHDSNGDLSFNAEDLLISSKSDMLSYKQASHHEKGEIDITSFTNNNNSKASDGSWDVSGKFDYFHEDDDNNNNEPAAAVLPLRKQQRRRSASSLQPVPERKNSGSSQNTCSFIASFGGGGDMSFSGDSLMSYVAKEAELAEQVAAERIAKSRQSSSSNNIEQCNKKLDSTESSKMEYSSSSLDVGDLGIQMVNAASNEINEDSTTTFTSVATLCKGYPLAKDKPNLYSDLLKSQFILTVHKPPSKIDSNIEPSSHESISNMKIDIEKNESNKSSRRTSLLIDSTKATSIAKGLQRANLSKSLVSSSADSSTSLDNDRVLIQESLQGFKLDLEERCNSVSASGKTSEKQHYVKRVSSILYGDDEDGFLC